MLKSHPSVRSGLRQLCRIILDDHTAHNSMVVCAAELGLFGLYFWSLFLFPTIRDALAIASPRKVSEGEPIVSEESLYPQAARKIEEHRQSGDQPPGAFGGFVAYRLSGCGVVSVSRFCHDFFPVGRHGRGGLRNGIAAKDDCSPHATGRVLP